MRTTQRVNKKYTEADEMKAFPSGLLFFFFYFFVLFNFVFYLGPAVQPRSAQTLFDTHLEISIKLTVAQELV